MDPFVVLLNYINQWIVTNGNREITAAVLNPVLQAMAAFTDTTTGKLVNLNTTDKTNLVAAINEVNTNLANINNNNVQVLHGTANPNTTPPPSFDVGWFYIQEDVDNNPVYLFIYDGLTWINLTQSFADLENLNLMDVTLRGNLPYLEISGSGNTNFTLEQRARFTMYDTGGGDTVTLTEESITFPIYSVLEFETYSQDLTIIFHGSVDVRYKGEPINSFIIKKGDRPKLKKIDDGSNIWLFSVSNYRQDFQVQVSQNSTSAPSILSGSLGGNRGAVITTSYDGAGDYSIISDLPIFADVLDCYKSTNNILFNLVIEADGAFGPFAYFWYVSTDYVIKLKTSGDYSSYAPTDGVIGEPILIKLEYKQ